MAKKQDFKTLQAKWYVKLKKSGFEDQEDENGNLKFWSQKFHQNYKRFQGGGWQTKAEYYRLAELFLTEYKFQDEADKVIWEYHANGMSTYDIADTFKKAKVYKNGTRRRRSRRTITHIITKLAHKMYEMYLAPKKEYRE